MTKANLQNQDKLSFDLASELFTYHPQTGHITWKINRGTSIKAGDRVGGINKVSLYVVLNLNGTIYHAHRLAWLLHYGEWPKGLLDHRNGIKSDNRITNLRECTQQQNMWNKKTYANNKTGYKGVSFHKASGKFRAQIKVADKHISLGYHSTPCLLYTSPSPRD